MSEKRLNIGKTLDLLTKALCLIIQDQGGEIVIPAERVLEYDLDKMQPVIFKETDGDCYRFRVVSVLDSVAYSQR